MNGTLNPETNVYVDNLIDRDIQCSIDISDSKYVFKGTAVELPGKPHQLRIQDSPEGLKTVEGSKI